MILDGRIDVAVADQIAFGAAEAGCALLPDHVAIRVIGFSVFFSGHDLSVDLIQGLVDHSVSVCVFVLISVCNLFLFGCVC